MIIHDIIISTNYSFISCESLKISTTVNSRQHHIFMIIKVKSSPAQCSSSSNALLVYSDHFSVSTSDQVSLTRVCCNISLGMRIVSLSNASNRSGRAYNTCLGPAKHNFSAMWTIDFPSLMLNLAPAAAYFVCFVDCLFGLKSCPVTFSFRNCGRPPEEQEWMCIL